MVVYCATDHINVGLFGWQIVSGVNITDPAPVDAIAWGADFNPTHFYGTA